VTKSITAPHSRVVKCWWGILIQIYTSMLPYSANNATSLLWSFQADLAVCRSRSALCCCRRCLSVKSTNRWCMTHRIRRHRRRWCVKDNEVSASNSSSSSFTIEALDSAKRRVPLHHLCAGDWEASRVYRGNKVQI